MVRKMGPVITKDKTYIDRDVLLGHPGKENKDLLRDDDFKDLEKVVIGDEVMIRSGSVIYEGVKLANGVETGHDVLIREFSRIGENSLVGSGGFIEDHCKVGDDVSIQSDVYLASETVIEDGVFLGPKVCVINDKYIDSNIEPARVKEGAKVGAGSIIMAGVEVGKDAMIGAGSVVTKDVPDGGVAYGNPAEIR